MFHFFSLPSVFLHLDVISKFSQDFKPNSTNCRPLSWFLCGPCAAVLFGGQPQLLVMAFEASRPQWFFINKRKWLPMILSQWCILSAFPNQFFQIKCCAIHKKQCLLHAAKKIIPRSPKWSRLRLIFAHGLTSNARLFRSLVPESMKREAVWWASPRIRKAFKRKPCQMSHKKTPRNFTRMKSQSVKILKDQTTESIFWTSLSIG